MLKIIIIMCNNFWELHLLKLKNGVEKLCMCVHVYETMHDT